MTTLGDAVAAPRMLKHRDVEYRMRPLTYEAIGEIERWIQGEHIAITKRNLNGAGQDIPAPIRERLMVEAFARASRINMTSPDADAIIHTAEGSCRLLHATMIRDHPDLTLEDVRNILSDPETQMPDRAAIDKFMDLFADLHPKKAVKRGEGRPRSGAKKAMRKKRRKK